MSSTPSSEDRDPDLFVTLRLPRSMHTEIRELAVANERTIAAEIRIAIRKHLPAKKASA